MVLKLCIYCNAEINNNLQNKKYCCKQCYTNHQNSGTFNITEYAKETMLKRITIKCDTCGILFTVIPSLCKRLRPKYCSQNCMKINKGWIEKNKLNHINSVSKIKKSCNNCKKEYIVHYYRKDNSKFCSKKCHDDHRRISKICPTCKKEFIFAKWENMKYCSQECYSVGSDKRNSLFSISVYDFLNTNNKYKIDKEVVLKNSNMKIFIDIVLDNKIAIECNGSYWHCDSRFYDKIYYHKQLCKTAEEIWKKDNHRYVFIKQKYKLIVLNEYDWNKNKQFFIELESNINEFYKNKIN